MRTPTEPPPRICVLLVALFALCAPAPAQSLEAKIDAIAADAMKQGPVAGLTVVVEQRGKVLLSKGYGKASLELDAPATAETMYHLDSITKHLTATAVLDLVGQGKLALDDPITKYLPESPAAWKDVRIRQLLSHTSGIRSFTDLPEWTEQSERLDHTQKEMFALIAKQPPQFAGGTNWWYSNSGYYLLGMILEKVTGTPYGDYMQQTYFTPLGMKARYCEPRPIIAGRAAGYQGRGGKFRNAEWYSWTAPFSGGSICATAGDIVRWELEVIGGRLGAAQRNAMRSPTALASGEQVDYGFGTRIGDLHGHHVVGHTGSGGGFNNAFEYFPADDLMIVVLTNTESRPGAVALVGRIARTVLGLPEPKPLDLPVPVELRQRLTGTFETTETTVESFAHGDRMRFRPQGGPPDGIPMSYQGDSTFQIDGDTSVRFSVAAPTADVSVYTGGLLMDHGRKK